MNPITLLTGGLNSILANRLANRWRNQTSAIVSLEPSRRILVIELGGLGDAVHAIPVLAALRRPVDIVCRDYVAELFNITGHRAIGITKSRAGVARAVKAIEGMEWDLIISTCWSTWATALALRANTKALCGFWRPWRIETFGWCGTIPTVSHLDHLATLRWKAIAPLGVPVPSQIPVASLPSGHDERTDGHVVVVPFCEDSHKSLTDAEARRLIGELDSPLLLGGVAEMGRLQNYKDTIVTKSISELLSVLASARCVISVDTGAMHLAAALGVKTIGIFRATDPLRCGPIGPRVVAVRNVDEALYLLRSPNSSNS